MEKVASTVHVNTKVLFTVFIVTSAGFVSSDFNQGRKECGDQLADFSACLPFVGGKAKSPTPTCCSNITKEGSKTRKCLCLLVKDRNDPRHGFKMNATLALSLPSVRHAPAKVSDCLVIYRCSSSKPAFKPNGCTGPRATCCKLWW